MIENLCQKLKDKRIELGYNLETVVERTKLHPSVIKAIEAGDLKGISPIYLKGFIRLYAEFLHVEVNMDELNSFFNKEKEKPKKEVSVTTQVKKIKEKKQGQSFKEKLAKMFPLRVRKQILSFVVVFIAVFLALKLVFGVFSFIGKQVSSLFKKKPVQTEKVVEVKPEKIKVESKAKPKSAKKTLSKTKKQEKEITVSMRMKRNCFVLVKVDDSVVFEGVLKKGVREKWEAKKEMEFKIRDGSAVEVEVNGEILPPLSKLRKPIKSLKITDKGVTIRK